MREALYAWQCLHRTKVKPPHPPEAGPIGLNLLLGAFICDDGETFIIRRRLKVFRDCIEIGITCES